MDKTKPKLKTIVIVMIMTLFKKDTTLTTYTYMITQGNLPYLITQGNLPYLITQGNLPYLITQGNLPYLITQGNLPIRTSSKRKSENKDKTNKINMSWRS